MIFSKKGQKNISIKLDEFFERDVVTTIIIDTNILYKGRDLPFNLPPQIKIVKGMEGKFDSVGFKKIEDNKEKIAFYFNGKWSGNFFNTDMNFIYSFLIKEEDEIKILSDKNFKIGLIGFIRVNDSK